MSTSARLALSYAIDGAVVQVLAFTVRVLPLGATTAHRNVFQLATTPISHDSRSLNGPSSRCTQTRNIIKADECVEAVLRFLNIPCVSRPQETVEACRSCRAFRGFGSST